MKSFSCVINDPLGIHARPAGKLAKAAKDFPASTITITKGDKSAVANQLIKLMGMGVKQNEKVTVTVDGGDEDAALAAMKAFFVENFSAECE